MALLCHPDNGGRTEDMQVVQNSYDEAKYILEQKEDSEERVNKVLDVLEKGEMYDNQVSNNTLPSIRDIFDEVHDTFHTSFAKPHHDTSPYAYFHHDRDPFMEQGYGKYMIEKWQGSMQYPPEYQPTVEIESEPPPLLTSLNIHNDEEHNDKQKNDDSNEDFAAKQLSCIDNALNVGYPILIHPEQHIHNFTVHTPLFENACSNHILKCTDYKSAFEEQ